MATSGNRPLRVVTTVTREEGLAVEEGNDMCEIGESEIGAVEKG